MHIYMLNEVHNIKQNTIMQYELILKQKPKSWHDIVRQQQ